MSTPSPTAAPSLRRDKPANRWHRNAGVTAAGVLVYLLATGIPLQFSDELRLGERYVGTNWILDWYGLQAPVLVVRSGDVVQVGQLLFLNEQPVATMGPLIGAVSSGDFIIAAGPRELLVFHRNVDARPETTQMSAAINQIGQSQQRVYLDTSRGLLIADTQILNWQPPAAAPTAIEWAPVVALTDGTAVPYRNRFRARMLTTERWLQDLHSGRFFGTFGVLTVDLASALLLILAGTGLVLWWRYRRS